MTNLKTIKKYEDKVQATQVSKLRLLEDKGNKAIKKVQIDTYKESTLKISLIIGKACEWFESEGRKQMQIDGIKIPRLNKEQSEIKDKEIFDEIEAKDAKKQDFVKMFFGYGRSQTFDFCKVYNLNPITRRKYLGEIAKKESILKVSNKGLIKFANGIESGKTAEDMQSEETDEKKAAAKAQYVYRDTVNDVQITVNAKGDIKVKGDAIKSLKRLLSKLQAVNIEEASEEIEFDLVENDILAGL
mgnify:FL=1|tara:strand:+ start:625 stop:1356 length:732 start_codon:yes stop_codon:yes gene_type:complete